MPFLGFSFQKTREENRLSPIYYGPHRGQMRFFGSAKGVVVPNVVTDMSARGADLLGNLPRCVCQKVREMGSFLA